MTTELDGVTDGVGLTRPGWDGGTDGVTVGDGDAVADRVRVGGVECRLVVGVTDRAGVRLGVGDTEDRTGAGGGVEPPAGSGAGRNQT